MAATDLSTKVLRAAQAALWPIEKADDIPLHYRKAFMLRGTGSQAGKMKAGPEIRDVVSFDRLNLNDAIYPVNGPFDFIFCRNVLIYFDLRVEDAGRDAAARPSRAGRLSVPRLRRNRHRPSPTSW